MEDLTKSVFDQTVLTSPEQLQILPENILSVFKDYQERKLRPTSKEELSNLLCGWFQGTLTKEDVNTYECIDTTCDIDDGLESNIGHKRQRFNSNI